MLVLSPDELPEASAIPENNNCPLSSITTTLLVLLLPTLLASIRPIASVVDSESVLLVTSVAVICASLFSSKIEELSSNLIVTCALFIPSIFASCAANFFSSVSTYNFSLSSCVCEKLPVRTSA